MNFRCTVGWLIANVTADEQLTIYAHLARTGLSSWMIQQRFQCNAREVLRVQEQWSPSFCLSDVLPDLDFAMILRD